MKRAFTPETVETILAAQTDEFGRVEQSRLPLHVNFSWLGNARIKLSGECGLDDPQTDADLISDRDMFNAIGSKLIMGTGHKPVLDIDGGAVTQKVTTGSKVVIGAAYDGIYTPASMLKDVLGDNGIDAEVFTVPRAQWGIRDIDTLVQTVVLRSREEGVFETVDSTTKGHSHLYIQQEFSSCDHDTLLQELGTLGIISQGWLAMTQDESMGVLRTPWTEKAEFHHPS